MPKEIETKFKIESPNTLKRGLKKIGARFVSKELERDTYYKSPSAYFRSGTIRLRSIGKKGLFTIKSRVHGEDLRLYKIRDELEVAVDDVNTFSEILKRLGFVPIFRKEKIRETYKWKNAEISIDKLPHIGFYMEIEGPKKRIKEIAPLLGLDMRKGISGTYMQLFSYHKLLCKRPNLELVFKD